ncbi:hypothetical protein A9Q76_07295 [Arcobacter sp. 31_11_sub10_T18]|nr:hypothetical protein A9Q76_07295 [Arcobacter sp. 31_11_sub10_T18]
MLFINTDKKFEEAVKEKSIEVVESLLQYSDTKCEMMKIFSQQNDLENLLCLLNEFKSKGLAMNIKNLCAEHNNFKGFYVGGKSRKYETIILEHTGNKLSNEKKHLQGSSFKHKKTIQNRLLEDITGINDVQVHQVNEQFKMILA